MYRLFCSKCPVVKKLDGVLAPAGVPLECSHPQTVRSTPGEPVDIRPAIPGVQLAGKEKDRLARAENAIFFTADPDRHFLSLVDHPEAVGIDTR